MKKNIKRIGAVLIAGTIVFAVAGCNKKEGTVSKNATVEDKDAPRKEQQEESETVKETKQADDKKEEQSEQAEETVDETPQEEPKKETTRRFDDKQFHGILYQIPIGWKEVLEDFDADIKFYQPTSDHWGQMEVVYQESPLVVGADDSTTILTTALIGNYSAKNFSGVKTQESNGINTIFAHVEFTDSAGEDFKGDCAVLNSDNGLISLFLMCEQDELLYDYTFPVVLEQIRIDQ